MGDGKENAPNKIFCCGSGYRRFISLLLSSASALDVRPAGPNGLVCHWVWHRALITLSGPGATVIPKLSSHLLYLLCRRGRGGCSCGCWLCRQSFFCLFVSLLRGKTGFHFFFDEQPSSRVHTCVVWSLASWNLSFWIPVCFPFLLFPYHTSVVITFTLFSEDLSVVYANPIFPQLMSFPHVWDPRKTAAVNPFNAHPWLLKALRDVTW